MRSPHGDIVIHESDTMKPTIQVRWNEYLDEVTVHRGQHSLSMSFKEAQNLAAMIRFAMGYEA